MILQGWLNDPGYTFLAGKNIQNVLHKYKQTMALKKEIREIFSSKLVAWYRKHGRDLPWRHTSDPYKIWVSEVMLQQTQVDTVLPYYHRFLQEFPDLLTLAAAPQQQVLKLWEGLGYYARARNLHEAARQLAERARAALPAQYDELLKIKGIGAYTAAAVASIAFGEPRAVVDGNVMRVLARLLYIAEPPAQYGRVRFAETAEQLMAGQQPGDFNQAMMELGAVVCKPRQPLCSECPVVGLCEAKRRLADPAVLPTKAPRKAVPHYDVLVGIIWKKGRILIKQRPANGLLGGLWELPGGKVAAGAIGAAELRRKLLSKFHIRIKNCRRFSHVKHAFSHFKITLHAFQCEHAGGPLTAPSTVSWNWVVPQDIERFAYPRATQKILTALLESEL